MTPPIDLDDTPAELARRPDQAYPIRQRINNMSSTTLDCSIPTATRVAGFRAGLDMGWCMTKGSTAIRIWAPWPPSKRELHAWRDAGADHDDKPRPGWRLASVFDKTRSPSLPRRHSPPRSGRRSPKSAVTCHEELVAELVSLADDIGYVVSFGDTGPAEGICHPESKRIAVAERLEDNGRVVALIHELAHALVAQDPDAPRLDYAQGELIAEPVAYCCCQTVVLDSLFGELARTPLSERSAPRAPAECAAPA